jgi:DNA polymerase III epsilon subunit-like protein
MWLVPPRYVVIDVETIAGCPEDAEAAFRRSFCPNPNWKATTIGERYLDGLQQRRERLSLLDASPIVTVSMATDADCRLLHTLSLAEPAIYGIPLEAYPDERMLLIRLREYLESCSDNTLFVGHNIVGFDLPRLRMRYLANGLRLPRPLTTTHQPVYDTMLAWGELFSVEGARYVSLHDCLEIAHIPSHKTMISGSDVQQLYESGDHKTLALYAVLDALAERALFLCMTGQAEDRLIAIQEAQRRDVAPQNIPNTENITDSQSQTESQGVSRGVREILASMGLTI